MHKRLWLLAGAAAAVLLLAASATARTTTSGSAHARVLAAAPFAQSWATTPRTVAARKAKDTVVIADEQDPSGFNVYQATQSSAWAGYMVTPVIRGAYIITDQGGYKLDLASSVKATKTSLTVTLRPDANWNDGGTKVPVTNADLKYTLDAFLNPNNQVASNTGYINIDPAKTQLVGKKTAIFHWRTSCPADQLSAGTCAVGAFADYRDLFGVVYPSAALAGLDWNTLWADCVCDNKGKPISDGPYILTNWTKGNGTTLQANPFWYGQKPAIKTIQWKFVADTNAEIQGMRGGEYDMIYPSPQTALSQLVNQPGLVYNTNRAYIFEHIDIQLGPQGNPLLKNLWMRQALFLAINRVSLIKAIFSSYAPGVKPLNSLEYILGKAAVPHFAKWSTSQKKAVALLKAHCTGGPSKPTRGNSQFWTCGGKAADFRWFTTVGNSRRSTSAAIFQQQLAAVGIKITPEFFPGPAVLFGKTLPSHDYDLAEYAFVAGSPDPSNNDSIFKSTGGQDYTQFNNHQVDKLIAAAGTDFNQTTRQAKYEAIDKMLATQLPIIPLYTYPSILIYRSALKGAEHSNASLSTGPAWNAEAWHWGA
jgi:peptide/nickel transport system substrate-binding protein